MKKDHTVVWDCISCTRRANRRDFLLGLGGLTAAALLRQDSLFAQATPFRVDVHHHFSSPAFQAELTKRDAGNPTYRKWVPQISLDEMDKAAVATSVLSVTRPGVWFGAVALGRKLGREANACGTRLVQEYQ